MTYIALSSVNEIYSCSSTVKITQHQFEHPEFRNFCLSLTNFERSLGENATEDYWQKFLRPLKQYRFKLCAAPLPFNHPTACQPETIDLLKKHLNKCKLVYPDLTSAADNIFNSLVSLSQSDDNPLLVFIGEHYSNIALLLQNSRLIPAVEDVLAAIPKLRQIELLMPSQLRGNNCFNKLVVIGAIRWFPDYVFTAPRAQEIDIIQYNWINDRWQPEPVFINSINNANPSIIIKSHGSKLDKIDSTHTDVVVAEYLNPDEILPSLINLSQIAKHFTRSSPVVCEEEYVEARLFLLEGETAVFLDANLQQHIIDLHEHGEDQVKKIPVTNIELGMFIVLRTSGGGDYIIPVANRILKEKATQFRELQKEWKTLLRNKVRVYGTQNVSRNLINLGSQKAKSEQNLRNWMSERSIKPDDDKDFNAVLRFVGLEDRLQEFHQAARSIITAHIQAGRHIRKLLLHQICHSDLQQLERLGKMDFELAEADCGSMTAFRVVDINTETTRVPYSKIAHPFSVNSEVINA
jgi:hypothetical protein